MTDMEFPSTLLIKVFLFLTYCPFNKKTQSFRTLGERKNPPIKRGATVLYKKRKYVKSPRFKCGVDETLN